MRGAPPSAGERAGYPPSPCTLVCTLDEHKVCLGCRRTLQEIVAWSGMSPEQQRAVIRQLPERG
ncbi:MAG: DUF1289 domain-containing protein [Woeseia sp.]